MKVEDVTNVQVATLEAVAEHLRDFAASEHDSVINAAKSFNPDPENIAYRQGYAKALSKSALRLLEIAQLLLMQGGMK